MGPLPFLWVVAACLCRAGVDGALGHDKSKETLDGDLLAARKEAARHRGGRAGRTASLTAEIAARRAVSREDGFASGRPRLRSEGPYFIHEKRAGVDLATGAAQAADAAAAGLKFASGLLSDDGGSGFAKRALSAVSRPHGLPESRASHAIAGALARALRRGTLTVAMAGHSAAAGHGNLFNESFPFAFQRLLGPALGAAGVELRVGNFALGGTHSRPHPTFCAREAWGEDVDYVN